MKGLRLWSRAGVGVTPGRCGSAGYLLCDTGVSLLICKRGNVALGGWDEMMLLGWHVGPRT